MLTITSDVIGYIAACLTTGAFVPQAWLTWRHKRAEGVSTGMYIIMVCGVLMWMIYGILLHAWPIIIANAVTLTLAMFILAMKIIYK
ncbi:MULTISPECIES: SemiSWEET transporter [unclassified Undibacterium]|uniref:SemiSWEET transporter n=1 Tax=unclassified Undibacterium TaxID=2630295 RepID=UPI003C2C6164